MATAGRGAARNAPARKPATSIPRIGILTTNHLPLSASASRLKHRLDHRLSDEVVDLGPGQLHVEVEVLPHHLLDGVEQALFDGGEVLDLRAVPTVAAAELDE